jgi:Ran GTPase-activating protein (RanGAP) involved in mRNA processing and transport
VMTEQVTSEIPPWLKEHCTRLSGGDHELTNLNLNIRRMDKRMMTLFSQSLQDNNTLLVLNLTSSLMNNMKDEDALRPFAEIVLPCHRSLKVLHLSYNRIQEVSTLGMALTTNNHLQEVYLDHNRIDGRGAQSLAEGLRKNSTLKVLCLSYNDIGDTGCEALAKALESNTSLLRLSLERNSISTVGAASLQSALQNNDTIRNIGLDLNDILPEQTACIRIVCRANEAGRKFLTHHQLSLGIWPALLEQLSEEPDLLYFFLHAKPDLCRDREHTDI